MKPITDQNRVNECVNVITSDPAMRIMIGLCKTKEEKIAFITEMVEAIY